MSGVECHYFFYKVVELVVGGSVINGPTRSSFIIILRSFLTLDPVHSKV